MWRLHGRRKLPAFAGKDASPHNLEALFTPFEKPLHSQADSEKRLTAGSALQQGLAYARAGRRLQGRIVSPSGQHDLVRGRHGFWLVRNHSFSAKIVERLLN